MRDQYQRFQTLGPFGQAARFLCHVYNRMRGPSSDSYASMHTSSNRGDDTAKDTEP
jgi:hypothetical protein